MENDNFIFKCIPSSYIKNLLEIVVKLKINNADLIRSSNGNSIKCRL